MAVVLDVGGGDHDDAGRGVAEDDVLHGGQSGRVEVFDDLHEHGGVVAGEARVLVGERALEQLDPLGLALAHPLQSQPAGRRLQGTGRDVGADDAREGGLAQEAVEEVARSAAEVDHRAGVELAEHAEHRLVALGPQGLGAVSGQDAVVVGCRVESGRGVVAELGEPGERRAGEGRVVPEVAAGDELTFRVAGEPALARAQELVDLGGALPVVLGLVEHREQDVELVERVRQADRPGEGEVDVAGVAPLREALVERDRFGPHLPAERPEDALGELGSAAAGQHGDPHLEGDRGVGELLTGVAAAASGGAEDVGHCHPEE